MNNYYKKIYLIDRDFNQFKHRSGWSYVLKYLGNLHSKDGIILDSFIEKTFGYRNILPTPVYKSPWIGFFHVPDDIPEWLNTRQTPKEIFKNVAFTKSLKNCKGLFCLSNYEKDILRKYTDLPIEVIYHPTEKPENIFSFDKFTQNKEKEIIQLGIFCRKLTSIFLLNANDFKKSAVGIDKYIIEKEAIYNNIKINYNQVKIYDYLTNKEYDELLSKNIVFLDLYDASGNNAVIECMVRNTPILINKHPAVVEYLGEKYPFYFVTLKEAEEKLKNTDLIKETHEYLLNWEFKNKLTGEYFIESFTNSEIYKNIQTKKTPFIFLRKIKGTIYHKINSCKNVIKKIVFWLSPKLYYKIKTNR